LRYLASLSNEVTWEASVNESMTSVIDAIACAMLLDD